MSSQEWTAFFAEPVEKVYAFFSRIDNLNRVTPGWFHLEILSPVREDLSPGMVFDYRLRLFGLWMPWRTLIEEARPPHRFVYTQARGPYAYFRHDHEFHPVDGGTLMVDRVTWRVGWGLLGELAGQVAVRPMLDRIFTHRRQVAPELLARF